MSTKRKANHRKPKAPHVPLEPGNSRHTVTVEKTGKYVRVQVEYMSYAEHVGDLGRRIRDAMYSAARMTDLRELAARNPDSIVEGEILVPDGTFVVQSWIPRDGELLVLKGRPSTVEDIATLDRYSEDPSETEGRKAEARRILDELNARENTPSVLAAATAATLG